VQVNKKLAPLPVTFFGMESRKWIPLLTKTLHLLFTLGIATVLAHLAYF